MTDRILDRTAAVIDTLTGSSHIVRQDFVLHGQLPFVWSRNYHGNLATSGPLGANWSYSYGHYLEARTEGIDFVDETGGRYALPFINEIGQSVSNNAAYLTATRSADDLYEVRIKSNLVFKFIWFPLVPRAILIEVRNLNGWKTSFSYDIKYRLAKIVDSAGRVLLTDCDADGRITAIRLRNGETNDFALARYEYDTRGDLVRAVDAAGNSEKYVYDENHRLIMNVNKLGNAFTNEYDSAGRCVRSRSDCGYFDVALNHQPLSKSVALTKPNGATEVYRYNSQNQLAQFIDPYGASTSYSYTKTGRLESELDPNGNASRISYDEQGNVVERTELDGTKWAWKYNELGLKTEETNPSGAKLTWKYDERGNVLEETDAAGRKTAHEYDSRGLCVSTILPDENVRKFKYSNQGLLSKIRDGFENLLLEFEYDVCGNIIERRSTGGIARFRYDELGRRIEVTLPDGTRERTYFDAEGFILTDEVPSGGIWSYAYEKCSLRVSETDPMGHTTRIEYEKGGNISRVVDSGGTATAYGYDLNSRIASISRNGRLRESYKIDRAGNFARRISPDGRALLVNEIGQLNRVAARFGEGLESRYEFDKANRLVSAVREEVNVNIKLDELDRVTKLAWNDDTIKKSYTAESRFAELGWCEGLKCTFEYPDVGPSAVIIDPCGGTHRIFGRIASLQTRYLPNGVSEVRVLNQDGGLEQLVLRRRGDTSDRPSFFLLQEFDGAGRISERRYVHRNSSTRFHHDALGRITSVAHSNGESKNIRYDAGGNALPNEGAVVKSENQLVSSGSLSYRYDDRGNVVERRLEGRSSRFTYNSWDEVTRAETDDGSKVEFHYDGLNKRNGKTVNGSTTQYNWHEHLLYREIRPDSSRRIYVHEKANDVVPFMFVDITLGDDGKCLTKKPYYVHADGNGIPVAISNEHGEIIWTLDVNPFGEFRVHDPHSINFNLRYPGQYFDRETGLCYNGFRVFDPLTHRFLQVDPIDLEGGQNLYQFSGDPLTDRDLLGMACSKSPTKPNSKNIGDGRPGQFGPRGTDSTYPVKGLHTTEDGNAALIQNPSNKPVHERQTEAQNLANKLHDAQSDERKGQTVAVGVMEDGSLIVTTKGSSLNEEQRAIIAESENTRVASSNSDAHAEQQLMDMNSNEGGVAGIAVSRPPCSGCAPAAHNSGIPTSHQPTPTQQKVHME